MSLFKYYEKGRKMYPFYADNSFLSSLTEGPEGSVHASRR
jgi:hypothetical protein